MKRTLLVFLFITLLSPLAVTVHAKELSTGSLIKGSGSAVYLYVDGKRFAFPNEKVFFSWYQNFDTVTAISDQEMSAIPLAGNATYRPGKQLVKMTTNPKVYAINEGNVLHWIPSEALAIETFGKDWAQMVHDVPDTFFSDYNVGININSSSDYPVQTILETYSTPEKAIEKTIASETPPATSEAKRPIPSSAVVTHEYNVGYWASSTQPIPQLAQWFEEQSAGWTKQLDVSKEDLTSRVLNFTKSTGDHFTHRSLFFTKTPETTSSTYQTEFIFSEVAFLPGYLAYPKAIILDAPEQKDGTYDFTQFTTEATSTVLDWYARTGAATGWSSPTYQTDPLNPLYRLTMQKEPQTMTVEAVTLIRINDLVYDLNTRYSTTSTK